MEMIVKVFDLCMFNRRVWFTTVNTTIDFNEPKVEVEVFLMRPCGLGQSQSKLPRTKYHWRSLESKSALLDLLRVQYGKRIQRFL